MPKLRKITYWVETLQKAVEAHTSYSDKKFRVALGVEFKDYAESNIDKDNKFHLYTWRSAGKTFVGPVADTEAEVERLWKDFIKHFFEQTQKVEKIILYKIRFSSLRVNQKDQGGYFDIQEDKIDKFKINHKLDRTARNADNEDNGAKIFFDFMVAEKRTIGKESRYYFIDKTGKVDAIGNRYSSKEFVEYPYSPEAEGFFMAMYSGLEGIMEKISKYLGNKTKIATSIASSQKLIA